MKYTREIMIDLPRDRVVELFDNPDNLGKWQQGLQSFDPLDGTPGQPGATARLVFDINGRKLEMIETIVKRDLPNEFTGTYDARNVHNVVRNLFYEDGPNRTRYVSENEFVFSGIMKVVGLLFGGSFSKTTDRYLQDFKKFAEEESA